MENKKYARSGKFNSDLAAERRRADTGCVGVEFVREGAIIGEWERIRISSEEGEAEIGRPKGRYDTLNLPPMCELDYVDIEDAIDAVSAELSRICELDRITPHRILVIGMGNRELTPDAVGAKCAELIEPTLHIAKSDKEMFSALKCSEIAVLTPGVRCSSGVDTADIAGGLAERICPTLVIAVDSLAARSPKRLGTTIQFCDTGILPGSGVGSHERAIDEDLMGAPVIAIGVPTVIDSRLLVEGESGPTESSMLVCPKDIDGIVGVAAKIIAGGINQAFGLIY